MAAVEINNVDAPDETRSGPMRIRMNDGSEGEVGPGDVASIPAGHDFWTP